MGNLKKNKIYLTNIFIIDWDDTLFPTTWITNNAIDLNSPTHVALYKVYFIELDKTISNLLKTLNEMGDVYIVTNANIGWIKTCLTVLELTRGVIIQNKIRIVSARDAYSANYNSPTEWKVLTFQNIVKYIMDIIKNKLRPNTVVNVISIGDAMYEYVALVNLNTFMTSYMGNQMLWKDKNFKYLLKNVKFMEKPDFEHVIEQIQHLDKSKEHLVNKMEFLDLKFM